MARDNPVNHLPPAAKPFVPDALRQLAGRVVAGSEAPTIDTRTLLKFFGYERRTPYAVALIRRALTELNLVTVPDFESAYLDGSIEFNRTKKEASNTDKSASQVEATETPDDPTFRLGKLEPANLAPVSVRPDDEVTAAITLMMARDFSQLPVMSGARNVKGVVTWSSIASKLALTNGCTYVRECYDVPPEILSVDTSLFVAVEHIARRGFVLVRDISGGIRGIVTAADVAEIFRDLGEPFLLLGEIENYLRRLIDAHIPASTLREALDPDDLSARQVTSAANLTFGEYIRLLSQPAKWQSLGLKVSRSVFLKDLEHIREIRNDVMHFDPDGLAPADLQTLRTFVQFLRNLAYCGAM